ncbi:cytochrome c-type biogenesis protein CcmE homolog, mitochondrial [Tanacetum coccineum]
MSLTRIRLMLLSDALHSESPSITSESHSKVLSLPLSPTQSVVTNEGAGVECFIFDAFEVLAKHDEKYMPVEVANAIEKNKKLLAEEAEAGKKEGVEEEGKEVKGVVSAK